jgi:hypothetical protein
MAGVKGRSGRRPETGKVRLYVICGRTVTDKDWEDIFRALVARAKEGDVRAFNVLAHNRVGPYLPDPDGDEENAALLLPTGDANADLGRMVYSILKSENESFRSPR